MALALPGLGLPTSASTTVQKASTSGGASSVPRSQTLQAQNEWRFEVSFSNEYTIKLTSGNAELWGTELAPNVTYTFTGFKGAVISWEGCTLEVSGTAEAEYLGEDTTYAVEWLNVHGLLDEIRAEAASAGTDAPRVLVVGPDDSGKTSLVRTLASWAVRSDSTPIVVNLDSREGVLAPPGSFTAVSIGNSMDVESGYGLASITGPTILPVRSPLIHSWPLASSNENTSAFKQVTTRMALHVIGRLEANAEVKTSGFIIDTPGSLNDPKTSYDQLHHIISEFSITHVFVLDAERLNADLNKKYSTADKSDVSIIKLRRPAGAVDRDEKFMQQLRTKQIRSYFFGPPGETLSPHSHSIAFSDLHIFKMPSNLAGAALNMPSFAPGGDDDDEYEIPVAEKVLQRIEPSAALTASLLAIKHCSGTSADEIEIRDSPVMGFVYVADVDETKKRVRFLAPHPQRWGDQALLLGNFPEAVPDLMT